jgi:hypothetical protein
LTFLTFSVGTSDTTAFADYGGVPGIHLSPFDELDTHDLLFSSVPYLDKA